MPRSSRPCCRWPVAATACWTYALSPESLPAGLTFDPTTRVLSGLPTAATGPRTYEYTATDADGDSASLTFTLEVVGSAADRTLLDDGLAAQGRALLSGATGVIGARFRSPGASSLAGAVTACTGTSPRQDETPVQRARPRRRRSPGMPRTAILTRPAARSKPMRAPSRRTARPGCWPRWPRRSWG